MRSPSTGAVEASYSTHFHATFGSPPESAVEGLQMSQTGGHMPVMATEVVDLMREVPDGLVVDATVGGGGHASLLLAARAGITLLGMDRDGEAIEKAHGNLAHWGERVRLRKGRFDELGSMVDAPLSGALFDLGVSSYQLDAPGRGFSYRSDGPLDMRMDRSQSLTAADVVNIYPVADLVQMFRQNGEGRFAQRIARSIVSARPIRTTARLSEVVRGAIPAAARRTGGHPATRVFQAIRIEVNSELEVLSKALDAAIDRLVPQGRCIAISYHSGEDRIVKDRFLFAASGGCTCPPQLPCTCGAVPKVKLLNRRARKPTKAEVTANPRAASGRLRAVERVPPPATSKAS